MCDPWWAVWHWSLFLSKLLCCSPATTSSRLRLKCDGTHTETRYHLSAKWVSPFKSAGASVQSTTGSRGVRISGSNAGFTMFRGSVNSTGYQLHSPVSPSLPLPCAITFQPFLLPHLSPCGSLYQAAQYHAPVFNLGVACLAQYFTHRRLRKLTFLFCQW